MRLGTPIPNPCSPFNQGPESAFNYVFSAGNDKKKERKKDIDCMGSVQICLGDQRG